MPRDDIAGQRLHRAADVKFVRVVRTVFGEPPDQGIARGLAISHRDKQPIMLDRQVVIRIAGFVQEKSARADQAVPPPHRLRAEQGKRHRFAAQRTAQHVGPLAFGQSAQKRSDPMPRGEK